MDTSRFCGKYDPKGTNFGYISYFVHFIENLVLCVCKFFFIWDILGKKVPSTLIRRGGGGGAIRPTYKNHCSHSYINVLCML